MTERELCERLSELANKIEELSTYPALLDIAKELRSLSNEKYTPGHTSWSDVKKMGGIPTKKERYPF